MEKILKFSGITDNSSRQCGENEQKGAPIGDYAVFNLLQYSNSIIHAAFITTTVGRSKKIYVIPDEQLDDLKNGANGATYLIYNAQEDTSTLQNDIPDEIAKGMISIKSDNRDYYLKVICERM
ncbi:uncharacterized protein LOC141906375 [Tubulanus polymorphus]|uniref:uncharacterized protein LOC141906375 n=1 Tax=Tubulanus polymorphus TaxID=672921 RepID=UPI003DA521C1